MAAVSSHKSSASRASRASRASSVSCVVVGAGLIGVAAAAELARRGMRVTLLERSIAGATSTTASSAAAGILGPQLEHDDDGPTLALGIEGARATKRLLAQTRAARAGSEVDTVDAAAVKVAFDEAALASLGKRIAWQQAKGLRAELVDGAEARRRVPSLSPAIVGAAFFPDDHALDPRAYLAALRALAAARGVETMQGDLREIVVERGRCVGIRTGDVTGDAVGRAVARAVVRAVVRADHVILAAGAWTARVPGLRDLVGLTLDHVFPVKGQIVELEGDGEGGLPTNIDRVVYGTAYVVPRRGGRVVCGSTMEPQAGFDTTVTDDAVARIIDGATRTLPSLRGARVRSTWAGLRPGTRDGLPILGPVARVPGLWISTGHFRNGVLLAAVSAELIASLVCGESVSLDLMPFRPERLG